MQSAQPSRTWRQDDGVEGLRQECGFTKVASSKVGCLMTGAEDETAKFSVQAYWIYPSLRYLLSTTPLVA